MTVRLHAFVAHQRTEAPIVQTLGVALLETGWRLMDVIPFVDRWRELASDAIDEADAFIIVATPRSLKSEPCLFEWDLALRLRKPVIRLDLKSDWEALVPDHLTGQSSLVVSEPLEHRVDELAYMLTDVCARGS